MRVFCVTLVFSLLVFVDAHKHPTTEQEHQVQRALQAAAHHCAPAVDRYTRGRMEALSKRLYLQPTLPFSQFLDQQNFPAGKYTNRPSPPAVPPDDEPSKNETDSSVNGPLSLNNEKSADDVAGNSSPVASQYETVQPEHIVPSIAPARRQNSQEANADSSKSAAHPPNDTSPKGRLKDAQPDIPIPQRDTATHPIPEIPKVESKHTKEEANYDGSYSEPSGRAPSEPSVECVCTPAADISNKPSAKVDSNRPTLEAPRAVGDTEIPTVKSQSTTVKAQEPSVPDQFAESAAHPAASIPRDDLNPGSNKIKDHLQPAMEVLVPDIPRQPPKVATGYTESPYPPRDGRSPTYEKPIAESDSLKPTAQYGQPEDGGSQAYMSVDSPDTQSQVTPLSSNSFGNACVLAPETNVGPKYRHERHPIRQNIAEYQDGLLLLLDIGVIDVETCEPLPNVLVDIWQANATGFYSDAPKVVDGQAPAEDPIWLRGAWPTDENGVAQFTTIYPGYYPLRATHIHGKVFTDWTDIPPSYPSDYTFFEGGRLAHVGQFFFSEELNPYIDKMYPYVTNPTRDTMGRTLNIHDALNIFNDSLGPEREYNPIFRTHLIGGVINQGLVGFITMGINASASYDLYP